MFTSQKIQHGFSMIEVLVSLIVIAVGMLGLSGLQIASMKGTNNAHSRNIATMLAMDLSDRMRANPDGVTGGFYENDVTCSKDEAQCKSSSFCTPEQIARIDVQEIMCGVLKNSIREGGAENLIPNGTLAVDYGTDCDATINHDDETSITLSWNESNVHKDQAGSTQALSSAICVIP